MDNQSYEIMNDNKDKNHIISSLENNNNVNNNINRTNYDASDFVDNMFKDCLNTIKNSNINNTSNNQFQNITSNLDEEHLNKNDYNNSYISLSPINKSHNELLKQNDNGFQDNTVLDYSNNTLKPIINKKISNTQIASQNKENNLNPVNNNSITNIKSKTLIKKTNKARSMDYYEEQSISSSNKPNKSTICNIKHLNPAPNNSHINSNFSNNNTSNLNNISHISSNNNTTYLNKSKSHFQRNLLSDVCTKRIGIRSKKKIKKVIDGIHSYLNARKGDISTNTNMNESKSTPRLNFNDTTSNNTKQSVHVSNNFNNASNSQRKIITNNISNIANYSYYNCPNYTTEKTNNILSTILSSENNQDIVYKKVILTTMSKRNPPHKHHLTTTVSVEMKRTDKYNRGSHDSLTKINECKNENVYIKKKQNIKINSINSINNIQRINYDDKQKLEKALNHKFQGNVLNRNESSNTITNNTDNDNNLSKNYSKSNLSINQSSSNLFYNNSNANLLETSLKSKPKNSSNNFSKYINASQRTTKNASALKSLNKSTNKNNTSIKSGSSNSRLFYNNINTKNVSSMNKYKDNNNNKNSSSRNNNTSNYKKFININNISKDKSFDKYSKSPFKKNNISVSSNKSSLSQNINQQKTLDVKGKEIFSNINNLSNNSLAKVSKLGKLAKIPIPTSTKKSNEANSMIIKEEAYDKEYNSKYNSQYNSGKDEKKSGDIKNIPNIEVASKSKSRTKNNNIDYKSKLKTSSFTNNHHNKIPSLSNSNSTNEIRSNKFNNKFNNNNNINNSSLKSNKSSNKLCSSSIIRNDLSKNSSDTNSNTSLLSKKKVINNINNNNYNNKHETSVKRSQTKNISNNKLSSNKSSSSLNSNSKLSNNNIKSFSNYINHSIKENKNENITTIEQDKDCSNKTKQDPRIKNNISKEKDKSVGKNNNVITQTPKLKAKPKSNVLSSSIKTKTVSRVSSEKTLGSKYMQSNSITNNDKNSNSKTTTFTKNDNTLTTSITSKKKNKPSSLPPQSRIASTRDKNINDGSSAIQNTVIKSSIKSTTHQKKQNIHFDNQDATNNDIKNNTIKSNSQMNLHSISKSKSEIYGKVLNKTTSKPVIIKGKQKSSNNIVKQTDSNNNSNNMNIHTMNPITNIELNDLKEIMDDDKNKKLKENIVSVKKEIHNEDNQIEIKESTKEYKGTQKNISSEDNQIDQERNIINDNPNLQQRILPPMDTFFYPNKDFYKNYMIDYMRLNDILNLGNKIIFKAYVIKACDDLDKIVKEREEKKNTLIEQSLFYYNSSFPPEFNLSSTSIKALDLLKRGNHLTFFEDLVKNKVFPNKDEKIVKLFKILLLLLRTNLIPSEVYYMTTDEVCNLIIEFYLENKEDYNKKILDLIKTNSVNDNQKNSVSTEKVYWWFKILGKDRDSFTPANINKINSTCGVFSFSLKEIIEFYGVIVDRKSSVFEIDKLNNFCKDRTYALRDKVLFFK